MADQLLQYEQCTPDEREVMLDRLLTQRNVLLDEAFRLILAADGLEDYRADGALSMADWLAYRHHISRPTARQWVRAATALEALPAIRERFVAGHLSFEQVHHAVGFATPADDEHLATLLPSLSCAEIELMATQRRRARRSVHDEARRLTHVRLRPDRSGMGVRLSGYLPNDDAAIVKAALGRRAEAAGPDPETGLWAPHDRRTAGALRDLCADDLARSAAEGSEPDAAMVVIHAPAELLADNTVERSATINGAPITVDVLRRFLCDTRIEVHYDTPDGRTIGVGRATRNPPNWLRRRVISRDHHRCRWPGCGRAIRHLHHMQHWTNGGPTDAANLMGVCWHHHHLLHEGDWNATGNADTQITITSPQGRTLQSRAGPMAA
ncbi:MAG: DUF222 domain-containing protein, partial [Acidimicrobiales bacterium]